MARVISATGAPTFMGTLPCCAPVGQAVRPAPYSATPARARKAAAVAQAKANLVHKGARPTKGMRSSGGEVGFTGRQHRTPGPLVGRCQLLHGSGEIVLVAGQAL
jgi:hypothetical protein